MEFDYPPDMTRKQALTRRARKLIGWLQQDRYAIYVDEESVSQLAKLIKIITDVVRDALDHGEDSDEKSMFVALFQDAKKILAIEEGEDQQQAYNETVSHLISSLESYIGYVEDME